MDSSDENQDYLRPITNGSLKPLKSNSKNIPPICKIDLTGKVLETDLNQAEDDDDIEKDEP